MTSNEDIKVLDVLQDIINYYKRGLEFKEEHPILFALQMATQVEENRIKLTNN